MCGILGSVNIDWNKEHLSLLNHRGPNNEGIEQWQYGGNKIKFGHKRLSIQDLSVNGNQPMYSQDGSFCIILNGEIYNHYELRKKIRDMTYKGHSDTETIINYLFQNGLNSVSDFNGIFVFGLYDLVHQKIYVVRDPFGVKPVYYFQKQDKFIFSSEIRVIKKIITTSISNENLYEFLNLRYNPSPNTLFKEIKKVRPGHFIEYDLTSLNFLETPYEKINNNVLSINYNEAIEEYGRLLESAITRQLISDIDVGMFLSGGLDSALVAYFAQKKYTKKIKTFTVGFSENDDANEINEAAATAKFLGTEHRQVLIDSINFLEEFDKIINIVEEPLGTTSIIPMYYLNQLASQYVNVILTGQGADEPLGGYQRYRGELLIKKYSWALSLINLVPQKYQSESLRRLLYSSTEQDTIKRFEKIYTLFSPDAIQKLIGAASPFDTPIKYYFDLFQLEKNNSTASMMKLDTKMNLADDLLLYTDKVSMNFTIEARVPFLDLELVRFIEELPLSYRVNLLRGKIIHKDFANRILPKEIVERKKKGFYSPTKQWFKGKLGKEFEELLKSNRSKFANYINTNEAIKYFKLHRDTNNNYEKQLFALIALYFWFEKNT